MSLASAESAVRRASTGAPGHRPDRSKKWSASVASVLERVLRVGEGRTLRRLEAYAKAVNALADDFSELTDEELAHETVELRERYGNGESLDDLLPEAFSAVREAAKRTLGMRHFDVQMMGGAALHLGNIA